MRNKKHLCPLLRKPCIEHECAWWNRLRGLDKNTGREVDEGMCAIATVPLLLVETSSQQRSTSAAVESFRNEAIARTEISNTLLLGLAQAATEQNFISPVSVNEILPPSEEQ